MTCRVCGSPVEPVAWALNLKIISRAATEFFCLRCLAEYFKTTVASLEEAAARYREAGCVLFK